MRSSNTVVRLLLPAACVVEAKRAKTARLAGRTAPRDPLGHRTPVAACVFLLRFEEPFIIAAASYFLAPLPDVKFAGVICSLLALLIH